MFGRRNEPIGRRNEPKYTTIGELTHYYNNHYTNTDRATLFQENTTRKKAQALYKVIEHILTSDPEDLEFGRPYNDSDTLNLLWDTGYEIILSYGHTFRNKAGTVLYNEPCILLRPRFHAFWGFTPATMNNENEIIMRKLNEKYPTSIMYKWDDLQRYDTSCIYMDTTCGTAEHGLSRKDYERMATYPLTDRLIIPFPNK